jgi:hypothetical protein
VTSPRAVLRRPGGTLRGAGTVVRSGIHHRWAVHHVPTSIVADGTEDVGARLTGWLSTIAGPARVVFPDGGVYRIDDGPVYAPAVDGVEFDFAGSTLLRTQVIPRPLRYPTHGGYFLVGAGSRNVTIRRLNVRGINDFGAGTVEAHADHVDEQGRAYFADRNGTLRRADGWGGHTEPGTYGMYCVALEFEHAVSLPGCQHVLVEDCDLQGMFGDGVRTALAGSRDITVRNVHVRRNGRQGITIGAGNGFTVDGCTIWSRRGGVDIEPDTVTTLTDVTIQNTTFNTVLLAVPSGGAGPVDGITIRDNDIYRTGTPFIHIRSNNGAHPRTNIRIERNTVHLGIASSPLIRLGNCHDVVVSGNWARATSQNVDAVGLRTVRCTGVQVYGNTFLGVASVVGDEDGLGSEWDEWDNTIG